MSKIKKVHNFEFKSERPKIRNLECALTNIGTKLKQQSKLVSNSEINIRQIKVNNWIT